MHCQKEICERATETNYYISNSKVSTKKSLAILRKYWKIESMALDIDLFLVFEFMKRVWNFIKLLLQIYLRCDKM